MNVENNKVKKQDIDNSYIKKKELLDNLKKDKHNYLWPIGNVLLGAQCFVSYFKETNNKIFVVLLICSFLFNLFIYHIDTTWDRAVLQDDRYPPRIWEILRSV